MNRRSLLKGLMAASIGFNGGGNLAFASPTDRVLVVVFMRGGWDGLNVAVPYGDDHYYALRPTLAISPPSTSGALSALDLDGYFGFHPALAPLHQMYQAGQVAVLPAVHYSGASRSHFMGQDIIETASATTHSAGWLARYLQQSNTSLSNAALSLSDQVPLSLAGLPTPVSAFPDLGSLEMASSATDREMLANVINRSYAWPLRTKSPSAASLQGIGVRLLDELADLQKLGLVAPAYGAVYPSGTFGRQMRQAASLIKSRAGHKVVTLNLGGWDTHSSQGNGISDGRMSQLLSEFSTAVSAFFTDLGADASRVVLLTTTEFGRTAAENGSGGTDHGNASTWLAVGPNVRGGVHLGTGWPGLASSQLVEERALAHSVDFRSIYANILSRHMGADSLSTILPGFSDASVDLVA
jgi:uncharacterized protein (DUF1501 family)